MLAAAERFSGNDLAELQDRFHSPDFLKLLRQASGNYVAHFTAQTMLGGSSHRIPPLAIDT